MVCINLCLIAQIGHKSLGGRLKSFIMPVCLFLMNGCYEQ